MSDTRPEFPMACQEPEATEWCREDVHGWFELSYSSYLVLPRSLMQEMPAGWQHAMVGLLERMREEFPGEDSRYTVLKKGERGNRYERDPLRNYRYPDEVALAHARGRCFYAGDDGDGDCGSPTCSYCTSKRENAA